MRRGEVWWAALDERRPVVVLSSGDGPDLRVVQIVEPATVEERRGFLILSGEQGLRLRADEAVALAGADVRAVGIEVEVDGLPSPGVVRVGLPMAGRIFCTWLATLTPADLTERIGELSAERLSQLDNALRLSGIE